MAGVGPLPIPDPLLVELKAAKKRQASEKLRSAAADTDLGYVVCNDRRGKLISQSAWADRRRGGLVSPVLPGRRRRP